MTRYVTNSELQTFKDCHRKWWLSFHRKLRMKRPPVTGPASIGTRVHHALQHLYTGGDPLKAYDDMCVNDEIALFEQFKDSEFGTPQEQIDQLKAEIELGRIMVEGYIEWLKESGADAGYEIVGAEEKVDVPFATIRNRTVRLLGKLDLRIMRLMDKARLFVDHKTCGSISARLQYIHMDEQFIHYQLLERLSNPDVNTQGSMIGLLRKVKRTARANPPFYHREEVHHSDHELRQYWDRVFHEIVDVLTLEDKITNQPSNVAVQIAYPRPSRDCSWKCEFSKVCPMFDDGSDAERFLADNFESYDPLSRYDERTEESE